MPKYHFGLATNNPREVSTCCNFLIALSAAAELLACCMCRRRAFRAGSLSLIVHPARKYRGIMDGCYSHR
ncbi:MAG: hypothetical protein ACLQUM_03610, partial [Steroidobacteraceae bacterium]